MSLQMIPLIQPVIDIWLTRFAAGAGTGYLWEIQQGCLVAPLPVPHHGIATTAHVMCPLTAQATFEGGIVLYAWDYLAAARQQKLPMHHAMVITASADGNPAEVDWLDEDPEPIVAAIRARLLRICGVAALSEGIG